MQKTLSVLAAALFFFASAAPAAAAGETVFVDIERVYRDSEVIQQVRGKVDAEFEKRQNQLEEIGAEMERGRERLQKESLTLSEEEQDSLRAEIATLERDFARKRNALLEDRGIRIQGRLEFVNNEIGKTIRQLAEEKQYALVLNRYIVLPIPGNRSFTHDNVLYAGENSDVTAQVVEKLDEGGEELVQRLLEAN